MRPVVALLACAVGCGGAGAGTTELCATQLTLEIPAASQEYDILFVTDGTPLPPSLMKWLSPPAFPQHGWYHMGVVTTADQKMHGIGDAAPPGCQPLPNGDTFIQFALTEDGLADSNVDTSIAPALACLAAVAPVSNGADPEVAAYAAAYGGQNPGFADDDGLVPVYVTRGYTTDVDQLFSYVFDSVTIDHSPFCADAIEGLDCSAYDFVGDTPWHFVRRCDDVAGGQCWRTLPEPACSSGRRIDVVRFVQPPEGTVTRFYCAPSCG